MYTTKSILMISFLLIMSVLHNGTYGQQAGSQDEASNIPAESRHNYPSTPNLIYSPSKVSGLRALVQLEWKMYHKIQHLYQIYKNKSKGASRERFDQDHTDVKTYLENFEGSTLAVAGNGDSSPESIIKRTESVSWNPLTKYLTVKRFRDFIQPWVLRSAQTKLKKAMKAYLVSVYNTTQGPDSYDFELAAISLVNIHYVHDLAAKDIANGFLDGFNTAVTLNARDCLLLGQYAVLDKLYKTAFQWFEHTFHLLGNATDTTVTDDSVQQALAVAKISHDENFDEQSWDDTRYFSKIFSQPNGGSLESQNSRRPESYYLQETQREICQGKTFQTDEERSKLFCWYEQELHPTYRIGPLKAEWLSLLPQLEVVHYYDVIGSETIESLKKFTLEDWSLRDSRTGDKVDTSEQESNRSKLDASYIVSKLIQRITGFGVSYTKRRYILSENTAGAYYPPHLDAFSTPDYFATFLLYLSDVARGGETVFLDAGTKAIHKRGSAVLWFNLFSCGRIDRSSHHGFCPIIYGEKLVIPTWISYHQSNAKCNLEPYSPVEVLVNGRSKYNHFS